MKEVDEALENIIFRVKNNINDLRNKRWTESIEHNTKLNCYNEMIDSLENIQFDIEEKLRRLRTNEKE